MQEIRLHGKDPGGQYNAPVPMIDSVIMRKGRFNLNGAKEGVGLFRPVVYAANQMRLF